MINNHSLKGENYLGLISAFLIITSWFSLLFFLLERKINFDSLGNISVNIFLILLMTHLYTGVFITAHDAIHGLVSRHIGLNRFIGTICTILFAFNSYRLLSIKHHTHHRFSGTSSDPDYYQGSFFPWLIKFMRQYLSFSQFFLMIITYNFAAIYFKNINLLLFWNLPAIISTFQLFFFGTYLPHRGIFSKNDPHKARSQKPNNFIAFFSCYFFGYHYEHHVYPFLPWWKLPEARKLNISHQEFNQ